MRAKHEQKCLRGLLLRGVVKVMFKLTKQREEGKKNMNEIDASHFMNKISHVALYIGFSYMVSRQ